METPPKTTSNSHKEQQPLPNNLNTVAAHQPYEEAKEMHVDEGGNGNGNVAHSCLPADVVVPPRRSYSYPRSRAFTGAPAAAVHDQIRTQSARMSVEGRKIFRGKSLTDDVLMRRFVVEEEAMMQVRRRNEMEIIRRRSAVRKRKIGPSPLSRMVSAGEEL
ncbi:UNVERIFIED_CONTAM: hypothetical protein Sindi_0356500 [Sesamum indicum]